MLECIEIQPGNAADAAIIWLHGLGADGHDFVPIVPELGLPADHGLRFIFPHAPVRPVTINGGMAMRAWYDILGFEMDVREDIAGINASRQEVEALIARENERGIASERIVLAGFSQGGATALHTALRHSERLAGILALSTYLPVRATLADEASACNRDIPIFMAHGRADPVLPIALGQASCKLLQQAGYDVAWHEYDMQHQVCGEEIQALGSWLRALLL